MANFKHIQKAQDLIARIQCNFLIAFDNFTCLYLCIFLIKVILRVEQQTE